MVQRITRRASDDPSLLSEVTVSLSMAGKAIAFPCRYNAAYAPSEARGVAYRGSSSDGRGNG